LNAVRCPSHGADVRMGEPLAIAAFDRFARLRWENPAAARRDP
jgi:hypothetical protein